MDRIVCIKKNCGQKFEVDLQEGTGAKQVQCPSCNGYFFAKKTDGEIKSF
jgi:DNA-directed RNA polymerase subunit RPC12/RpoP